jgi:O-methyltransferase involved in polyketide biosynthesis
MESERDLAETASLVNESRRRREDVSRDRFAKLWVLESAASMWDEMAREVGHSDVELPLWNRFFLDRLDYFLANDQVTSFVNFGAGFTSYPFLTGRACPSAEIDLPHVIRFKRDQVAQWQNGGQLPNREVSFHAADFTDRSRVKELVDGLRSWLQGCATFVLMEGLTYYLPIEARRRLFEGISSIQTEGSILAFDFWDERSLNDPITLRWRQYLACKGWHDENAYSPIELAEVASFDGYELLELANAQILAGVLETHGPAGGPLKVLPEFYAVLRRAG